MAGLATEGREMISEDSAVSLLQPFSAVEGPCYHVGNLWLLAWPIPGSLKQGPSVRCFDPCWYQASGNLLLPPEIRFATSGSTSAGSKS
jgi:hypothetical protein